MNGEERILPRLICLFELEVVVLRTNRPFAVEGRVIRRVARDCCFNKIS